MTKLLHVTSIAFFTLLFTACGSILQPNLDSSFEAIKPGNYALDINHTAILFKINHLGFSKFVGRFEKAEATLNYDPEFPENSSLDARVDMASVNVNNAKFEKTLRNRFWFDTENHPKARFTTSSARKTTNNQLIFDGMLDFMGIKKPLTLHITINGAGNNIANGKYTLGFSATAMIQRSDHALDRFSPAISDEVELEVHAEFLRQ
ncbi:MAG: YceI family protein [Cellvibrionaceae bacterium]